MPAAANAPGNHILTSLLVHIALGLGFHSEFALRSFSLASLVALVPVTYALARRLGAGTTEGLAAAALVATSPTLARYGIAVRGYILAALFATLALWCYSSWLSRPRRALSLAAGAAGALAVLANFSTFPVVVALIAHALLLPLDRSGHHPWRSRREYETLVRDLFGGFIAAIGLHIFMLPHLAYGSVAWSTIQQMTIGDGLGLLSAPFVPPGMTVIKNTVGVAVGVTLAVSVVIAIKSQAFARTSWLLCVSILGVGLLAFLTSGQTGGRVVIYLVPIGVILMLRLAGRLRETGIGKSRIARAMVTIAVFAIAAGGAAWTVTRPPLSQLRETAAQTRAYAAGRPIWTSTLDQKVVTFTRFYLPELQELSTEASLPDRPSLYFRSIPEHTTAIVFMGAFSRSARRMRPIVRRKAKRSTIVRRSQHDSCKPTFIAGVPCRARLCQCRRLWL